MNNTKKPTFYAIRYSWNDHRIKPMNVISTTIIDDLKKKVKKGAKRSELKERLISLLKHYYWSKAEHEIMAGDLFCKREELEKIDIWFQLEPNVDLILDIILEYICPRKFKRGDFSDESNRV